MNNKNDTNAYQAAFPGLGQDGLSKREFLAGMIMASLLGNRTVENDTWSVLVTACYFYADAILDLSEEVSDNGK